jgi:hypothetical protein
VAAGEVATGGGTVFDEDQLRAMSSEDRLRLLHTLAEIEATSPLSGAGPRPRKSRRRLIAALAIAACCVILAAWTGVLATTLPLYYRAGGWRGAWVGFDIALLVALAVTGWAAWRGRQVLILCLIVVATLLLCDAWFDVILDLRTSGFQMSLLTALLVEVPLATLAILGARRLLKLTISASGRLDAPTSTVSLWRAPLFRDAAPATLRALVPQLSPDSMSRFMPDDLSAEPPPEAPSTVG